MHGASFLFYAHTYKVIITMKKVLYLMAAAMLTACGTGGNGYTITGTVEGSQDGDSVFLQKIENRQSVRIAATTIKNGSFSFSGTQDTTAVRYITHFDIDDNTTGIDFFLENGNISIDLNTVAPSATGTPNNNAYQAVRDRIATLKTDVAKAYDRLSDSSLGEAQRDSLMTLVETLDNELSNALIEGCRNNIDSEAGIYLLKQSYYYMDDDQLTEITDMIPERFFGDSGVASIKAFVGKKKATAVGLKYTDLQLHDPDGKDVKLSDYVGKSKLVLVDFWASWCGPCRDEMPTLVKAYAQYKDKGFQIVGVSLDSKAESWKKGISDLGITWPQMSDLKHWDSAAADIYAVNSIPHTVLIDQDGTIVARGLRGEALLERLKELDK